MISKFYILLLKVIWTPQDNTISMDHEDPKDFSDVNLLKIEQRVSTISEH